VDGPVLHVITRMEAGGAPRSLLLLLSGLRDRGVPVELASGPTPPPARDLLPEAVQLGIPVHPVRHLRRDPQPPADLMALAALVRLIRRRRPALVHAHTSKAGFLARLAARLTGVPSVYSPRGTILEGYFTGWRQRLFLALDRRAARWSRCIVGLTPEESQSYLAAGIGTPDQHVQIPIGVDLASLTPPAAEERARLRQARGIAPEELVLVTVGRLVPVKDQATLVRGLARLGNEVPPWRCRIVGDGPEEASLRRLVAETGLTDRVTLTGPSEDVPGELALADLFVLTSINEGFGRVLLEAMAARLPVVATAVGGIPSVLDGGRVGLLVPAGDPPALAGALTALIASPAERDRLARSGYERVRDHYSLEAMVDGHRDLYERLLADTGKAARLA
jgi:glycosyltransferase involved in cell wall biosynthesis